jgi:predicted DNA-binding transcriptional regulator AlpA
LQRSIDEEEPAMTIGYSLEDDDEVGCEPWALGVDEAEPAELVDDGDEVSDADRWLDEQLGRPATHRSDATFDGSRFRADEPIGEETFRTASGGGAVVLRRSAPTRPRRRRLAEPDAAADLPAPNLAGYVRDRRGTWRYAATGRAVPGARDLTLRSLYRFPVRRNAVHVPADLARSEPELVWTLAWKHTLTAVLHEGRLTSILRIPVGEWERRADIPFGVCAPELTATQLLGIGAVAHLAGVTAATITAYLARGRMPAPVTRIGNSPVWSRPVIQQWLASRPGQGARGRR